MKRKADVFGYMDRWELVGSVLVYLAAVVIVLFILLLAAYMVVDVKVEADCLSHGWKDSKVDWKFEAYCIREENEYEIVKPLSEILEQQ